MMSKTREPDPRILVVGCGGIGGLVAAGLCHQGHNVTPLTHNVLIADAINTHGFRTQGALALGTVPARAVTTLGADVRPFDYILLATQPPQVEEAARQVLPHLAENGSMVCFQNGLCEPRIADIAGSERVIGAIISWGASMLEPGVYDRTSAGGFTIGRLEGPSDEKTLTLCHLLEAIGPTTPTDNLMGARWSKLAINCAISSIGTIGGERLGRLLSKRYIRRLALEVMTETVQVAHAEGQKLEKVSGTIDLEWMALTETQKEASLGSPSLFAKHALLVAVGTRYRRLRSSMLSAIERGREPAIDFLNGEVVVRAQEHGIATPVNEQIVTAIKHIVEKKTRPGEAALETLFQQTRPKLQESAPVG